MSQHYSQRPLTNQEWKQIEAVLLDEVEIQVWYAVTFVPSFGGEIFVTIQ